MVFIRLNDCEYFFSALRQLKDATRSRDELITDDLDHSSSSVLFVSSAQRLGVIQHVFISFNFSSIESSLVSLLSPLPTVTLGTGGTWDERRSHFV